LTIGLAGHTISLRGQRLPAAGARHASPARRARTRRAV